MTPQFSFMVLATVIANRQAELRELLLSMNQTSGDANPANSIVPFAQIQRLHFARFVILDDGTSADISVYGLPAPAYPVYLAFLGEYDGPAEDIFYLFEQHGAPGLKRIFSFCTEFSTVTNLEVWMKAHSVRPATMYINQRGRTMHSVRENAAVYNALEQFLASHSETLRVLPSTVIFERSKTFIFGEAQAGRLALSHEETTPFGWRVKNLLHLFGIPLVLLLISPLLIVYAPFFLLQLWRHERSDPEITPRVSLDHANVLAHIEDRDCTNQFSAFGSVKPGLFRRWTLIFILWLIQYTTQHIYHRGRLARVSTIHFARWVWLDDKKRLFFASNYDGSLEAYMDDFINKVFFGLNAVFSNGIGYPTTRWLVSKGATDELKFKYYIRRHQLPTEVWYNAHPGLTALTMQRNERIRQGIEKSSMTKAEASAWLDLL